MSGNRVERELACRQLAVKDEKSKSWFVYVKKILQKYDLPGIYDLLENPIKKEKWKETIKRAISQHWVKKIQNEAEAKTSLKHLNAQNYETCKPHNIWKHAGVNTLEVKKAGVKALLLAGVYKLQKITA